MQPTVLIIRILCSLKISATVQPLLDLDDRHCLDFLYSAVTVKTSSLSVFSKTLARKFADTSQKLLRFWDPSKNSFRFLLSRSLFLLFLFLFFQSSHPNWFCKQLRMQKNKYIYFICKNETEEALCSLFGSELRLVAEKTEEGKEKERN